MQSEDKTQEQKQDQEQTSMKPNVEPTEPLADIPVEGAKKEFPPLHGPQPFKRWHSKTSRLIATEIPSDQLVFLRHPDGSIKPVDKGLLGDTFGEVKSRSKITGPGNRSLDCITTSKGEIIVYDDLSTVSFENADKAKQAGYSF